MKTTRDRHLHWTHPLPILMTCASENCTGVLRLCSVGRRASLATGQCPACGRTWVLRAGVLEAEPEPSRRPPERRGEVE